MLRQSSRRLSSRRRSSVALELLDAAALTLLRTEINDVRVNEEALEEFRDQLQHDFLSHEWVAKWDATYNDYYYENLVSQVTTWERPPHVLWLKYIADDPKDNWYVNLDTQAYQKQPPVFHELNIVHELKTTELTYIRKLRLLTGLYSEPLQHLQVSGTPLLDEASWRMIFGNTESILKLAEAFYGKLDHRRRLSPQATSHRQRSRHAPSDVRARGSDGFGGDSSGNGVGERKQPHQYVLEAFSDLVKFFKLYMSYFDNYQDGTEQLLKVMAQSEQLSEFLRTAQAKCVQIVQATDGESHGRTPMARDRNGSAGGLRRGISGLSLFVGAGGGGSIGAGAGAGARAKRITSGAKSPTTATASHENDNDSGSGDGGSGGEEPELQDSTDAANYLQGLRILPVQRLPRYVLLLERLLDSEVGLRQPDAARIQDMIDQVRKVAQDCDRIVSQTKGWRKMWQVQNSIRDFRFIIMCRDRTFLHDGSLVAVGRDPVTKSGGLKRARSSSSVGARGRAQSADPGMGGSDVGRWVGRKERTYKVFLFDDLLIFCKPTHKDKGQQMYDKRGVLLVRRVVDCRVENDPSSARVFRVYGTLHDLHSKLLWTQSCGEADGERDEFDAAELLRLQTESDSTDGVPALRESSVVQRANADGLGSVTFRAKDALDKIVWLQKFCEKHRVVSASSSFENETAGSESAGTANAGMTTATMAKSVDDQYMYGNADEVSGEVPLHEQYSDPDLPLEIQHPEKEVQEHYSANDADDAGEARWCKPEYSDASGYYQREITDDASQSHHGDQHSYDPTQSDTDSHQEWVGHPIPNSEGHVVRDEYRPLATRFLGGRGAQARKPLPTIATFDAARRR